MKISAAARKRFLECARALGTTEACCASAGFSQSWFYDRKAAFERGDTDDELADFGEFLEEIKEARSEAQKVCLDGIMQAGVDGKWQAFAWLLERRCGMIARTEQDTKIEHKVDDGGSKKQLLDKLAGVAKRDKKSGNS